jgi:Uma2 family endonuclease
MSYNRGKSSALSEESTEPAAERLEGGSAMVTAMVERAELREDAGLPDEVKPFRWTREDYEELVESGVFEGWRIELVEGVLYEMTVQSSQHATGVRKLQRELEACLPEGFDVRSQMPFSATDDSMPEPDIAVVPGGPDDYADAHPRTAVLVAEVTLTSLRHDRERKKRVYARAGIPEYWIENPKTRELEVYREPAGDTYASRVALGLSDQVSPLFAPEVSIPVAKLFPKG